MLDPADVKTEKDCAKVIEDMQKEATELKADIWAQCVEVKHIPKIPTEGGKS